MPDHNAAALIPGDATLTRRSLSDQLRYLADKLISGTRPDTVAFVLKTIAAARAHEHEWTRCSNCPHPGQPCTCSGVAYCEGERSETLAIAEAVYAERERLAQLADQHHAHYECDPDYGEPFSALIRAAPADREITHQCPPEGNSLMPCCGRTPYDVPPSHRITLDPALVTCKPPVQRTPPAAFGKAAE